MGYLLRAFGHETLEVHDGANGLQQASREKPDLILLDIHMPRMDGYEVARLLRAESECCRIPIIAVTALAMVGDRERILASGFSGYIAKPLDPETFPAQVNGYLGSGLQTGLQPAVQWPREDASEKAAQLRNGSVVLVVDNLQTNIDLVRSVLEPSGFKVIAALSAGQGFDLAQRTKPDLVLSDVHMLHHDGYDFLRMMQTAPEMSRIPFVFLSSSILTAQERERALRLGAKKFISRPIEPQVFLDQIIELIPRRATSQARAMTPSDPGASEKRSNE